MNAITQAHQENNVAIDTLCDALSVPRASYYRNQERKKAEHVRSCSKPPKNTLSDDEKLQVLDMLHSERFVDKTPYEAYYELIDRGEYYCSPRTMYRILAEQGETAIRRHQQNHRDAVKPELIATRPNEVWSWDITKFLGPRKFNYFYLYVILDIFSRYVVGWLLADCESKIFARQLIQQSALKQGIQRNQLTLHADNGASMKSQTVAQLLDHLGITKTHNRPYTSDDNPYSESQFKTLKYRPDFPVRFETITDAEKFCKQFFTWYNKEHYHSGIAWLTPHCVHAGQAELVLENRHAVLMKAYNSNPTRFNNKQPRLKQLPSAVYINPPQAVEINCGQKEGLMTG
jgi:putative transposase